ncbi:divalent-cation tolerance protein CutA [Halobacteriales archaeon SW_7_68_16]|nr:MAG: divalent-cation tolerance protein CutA [Halobacteriales archaeon SW_7_68_16]
MTTVYATAPRESADDLAEFLGERLAACMNVLDRPSTYRYEGEIRDRTGEASPFAKTTPETHPRPRECLLDERPHDGPCIERFDEDDVLHPFGNWVAGEVGDRRDRAPGTDGRSRRGLYAHGTNRSCGDT